jgi:hypothetical protein
MQRQRRQRRTTVIAVKDKARFFIVKTKTQIQRPHKGDSYQRLCVRDQDKDKDSTNTYYYF